MTISNEDWSTQDTGLIAQLVAGTLSAADCTTQRAALADQWNGGSMSNKTLANRFTSFLDSIIGILTVPYDGGDAGDGTVEVQNSAGLPIVLPGYQKLIRVIARGEQGVPGTSAMGVVFENQPASSERIPYPSLGAQTFTKMAGYADKPATAQSIFTLVQASSGAVVGTATFAAGQHIATCVLVGGQLSLPAGDAVVFISPATIDSSIAGVAILIGN